MDEGKYMTIYFQKGSILNKETESKENILSDEETKDSCAKVIKTKETGNKRYFIRFKDASFIDPFSADYFRMNPRKYKWQKVSEDVFNDYAKYLRNGNKANYQRALRSL